MYCEMDNMKELTKFMSISLYTKSSFPVQYGTKVYAYMHLPCVK
jgi:hypothetical protein